MNLTVLCFSCRKSQGLVRKLSTTCGKQVSVVSATHFSKSKFTKHRHGPQAEELTSKLRVVAAKLDDDIFQFEDMSGHLVDIDVSAMRKPYHGEQNTFDVIDLASKEPITQFAEWFKEACNTKEGIMEANAMSLATATKDGRPSIRTVLLKGFDKDGFKFYTNYTSRKAAEMEQNPHVELLFYWSKPYTGEGCTYWSRQEQNPKVSLMFYWEPLKKSVRIEGTVERLPSQESSDYFLSRPRDSQLGAWASNQSTVIPNKQVLSDKYTELKRTYSDVNKEIPKPDFWGGYLVRPEFVEFWQGQTNRLHDRIRFRRPVDGEVIDDSVTHKGEEGWLYERLSP